MTECLTDRIRAAFRTAADPGYLVFTKSLNPSPRPAFGVRMPALRAIARDIIRAGDTRAYLDAVLGHLAAEPGTVLEFEWTTLGSIVLGRDRKIDPAAAEHYFAAWLGQMDGWGVCDCHGSEACFVRRAPFHWQGVLTEWIRALRADDPFSVWRARVALVVILAHYKTPETLSWALDVLEEPAISRALSDFTAAGDMAMPGKTVNGQRIFSAGLGYYLSMACAWCWTTLYAIDNAAVRNRLLSHTAAGGIDALTAGRVLGKVRDSFRISPEETRRLKEELQALMHN